MTAINPIETFARQKVATGPFILFVASMIAAVVFAAIIHHSLPHEVLLPATVTFVFVLAAAVALFAWRSPVPSRQFTYWDAAGLLTLFGVMATTMVEPADLVRLVVDTSRHN
jgi:hypothetical protein